VKRNKLGIGVKKEENLINPGLKKMKRKKDYSSKI
jgi:hypothetical protein